MTIENSERPTVGSYPEPIVGRFAPSPTGELHMGSLTTAIASYCHIRSLGGEWLLRIEDTDQQRCLPQFSEQILIDLEKLGLHWDRDIWYQSERHAIYNELLHTKLIKRVYACDCSRKQLANYDVYPRFCLPKPESRYYDVGNQNLENQDGIAERIDGFSVDKISFDEISVEKLTIEKLKGHKVRIQLPNHSVGFMDRLQGVQWTNPQTSLGDVVLRRADGTINYFLAASVDDGLQGVTHVMRGLDILPLTTAQIKIMSYLDMPSVNHWYHLPLVENEYGQKLSKQNLAAPIDTSSLDKCQSLIQKALQLLQQPSVDRDKPETMLAQATSQWTNSTLKNRRSMGMV